MAQQFAKVEAVFREGLRRQAGGGAAFAATVDGQVAVSLWGGQSRPGVAWSEDTPALLMSVTKGWAAMCVQLLLDRGLLALDEPVCTYWPEFAANGKDQTTLRHVLLHQSGVLGLPRSWELLGWDGRGWEDSSAIAAALAAAEPVWKPGTAHGYHAVTYGWLVGEIVRRVTSVRLGVFFDREFAKPLGLDCAVGIPDSRVSEVAAIDMSAMFDAPAVLRPVMNRYLAVMSNPETPLGLSMLGDGHQSLVQGFNTLLHTHEFFRAEIPSSNGIGSAKDLAMLYSLLAVGGADILSADVVTQFSLHALTAPDEAFRRSCQFFGKQLLARRSVAVRTLGYTLNQPVAGKRLYGPNPDAYGSEGAGGQFALVDPGRRISIAFVRSKLRQSPAFWNDLIDSFYACL